MQKEKYSELANYCNYITSWKENFITNDSKLGHRLVCPEYSKFVQEIKTYPLHNDKRIFALCWNISQDSFIRATMCPSPEPFCYQTTFANGDMTQLHTHEYIELAYVVKGQFCQKILDKDIIFKRGEICLIDKNCLHQDYLYKKPATILFLGIANDMFSEIMNENVTTKKIISFLQSALLQQKDIQQYLHFKPEKETDTEIENCLYLILQELWTNNIGAHYICKGLLLRIFSIMSTRYCFSLSKEQRKTMNWIVFEEISEYIQQHYSNITIQNLMNQFHFQEDYFNRLIKSKTGLTYSAYLQQIRLKQAERLLTTTKTTIEKIASTVGYQNKGYFYKIFYKEYKMTPSQYRKKMTNLKS